MWKEMREFEKDVISSLENIRHIAEFRETLQVVVEEVVAIAEAEVIEAAVAQDTAVAEEDASYTSKQ